MKNYLNKYTHGSSDPLQRYIAKLDALPPTGTGYHPGLLGVANLGVIAGLPDDVLYKDIRAHTEERSRNVPDSEIRQAIEKARKDHGGSEEEKKSVPVEPKQPAPRINLPYTPGVFRRRLIEAGKKYTELDFINASSMHLSGHPSDDALCILDAFYSANEYLFIGNRFYKEIHRVEDWRKLLLDPSMTERFMPHMPHIIPNPVTGEQHEAKDGKLSYRCDASIKDYRFAVAEFDNIPRADQLAFWASIPLPIAALIDSGGKSIHAWIKLSEIYTPKDWRIIVKETLYRQMLVPMGCDPACSNPSRLSRFPGHLREEKKNWQRLLYINQNPSPKGIFRE